MISIAPGISPAPTTSETVCPACCMSAKNATSVRQAGGAGITRRVILVAMPSVPSLPTNAPSRS